MENSRVLAKVIGPLLIILAVGVFLNLETYQHLFAEFCKSAALCYLGGFVALLLGLIILQFHNVWEPRWPVVITILGWIMVVKGVVIIVFPGLILYLWCPPAGSAALLIFSLGISLVVGVFVTIKGYWG
jgi:hypothetical protein